jgi:hypothetical protein
MLYILVHAYKNADAFSSGFRTFFLHAQLNISVFHGYIMQPHTKVLPLQTIHPDATAPAKSQGLSSARVCCSAPDRKNPYKK